MTTATGKKNLVSLKDFKTAKNRSELIEEMRSTEKQARLLNESISRTLVNIGTAESIQNGIVPSGIDIDGFDFKLIENDKHAIYRARSENDFIATITYRKRRKEFITEMLPGYKNLDAILDNGLDPQKFMTTFKL